MSIESGSAAIPFVRMFYGQAATYLWEDNEGMSTASNRVKEENRGPNDALVVRIGSTYCTLRHPGFSGR